MRAAMSSKIKALLLLTPLLALACGGEEEQQRRPRLRHDPAPVDEVTVLPPADALIFPAPIGPTRMARVRQQPELAREVCEQGCAGANAQFHRVRRAPVRWGWECLCALAKESRP